MLGRFGRDAGSLLGVEITSDSIRMLQLRRQRGGWRAAGWGWARLQGPPAENDARLAQALRQVHGRCATRQRQVALALPASQVLCKVCRMPDGLCERTLETMLLAQADQLFPFALDDLALDFQVAGASASEPGAVDMLVAACRQSLLEPFEQLLATAGLQLVAVEIDSLALRRALAPEASARTAVLKLEAKEVVMHTWQDGPLPRCQPVPHVPGEHWLNAVERFWVNGRLSASLDEVVVAGAGADAELVCRLAARVGVNARLGCPEALADCPGGPEVPGHFGASMALACGLALAGVLLLDQLARSRLARQLTDIAQQQRMLAEAELTSAKLEGLREARRVLDNQRQALQALRAGQAALPALFSGLQQAMPEGVQLIGLSLEQDRRLTLTGLAASASVVAQLMRALQQAGVVMDLELVHLRRQSGMDEFQLAGRLPAGWS
ncbi:pilus assembly protein PilM [Pantoea sp. Cy-639]|uniref:pilus assembly protein PilM n=1 Tax=Pantoea sp. Cy-639 TaxID=2608360 RepID=UPI0014203002|nr:pilus assembly protein PilM [Pantoea sp. Cy-639]